MTHSFETIFSVTLCAKTDNLPCLYCTFPLLLKMCLICIAHPHSYCNIQDNSTFFRDKNNNITTKLYDKRDAFGIVNFPFMSSNIPSAPAYGVYASQLIRYACCCSNYSDLLLHHRALVTRLLSQAHKVNRLSHI